MATEPSSLLSHKGSHNDEDDDWIPIVAEDEPLISSNQGFASVPASFSTAGNTRAAITTTQRESLASIQQRLESRKRLREGLVEHPLNCFYARFLVYVSRELWNQDSSTRAGLTLAAIGSMLQFLSFLSHFFNLWYFFFRPKLFFLLSILLLSYLYLANIDIGKQLQAALSFLTSPSIVFDRSCQIFDRFQVRWAFFFLLLVPTLLEAKTLAFLSGTLVQSGWLLNCAASLLVLSWMLHQSRVAKLVPRDCTMQGMLILYGAALLVAIAVLDVRRMHVLGGPFLMATGSLLVSRHQDESRLSRAVRQALRLSLRDVLATLGETVQEDEMLQLAMIRWIVDYWSYAPPSTNSARSASDGQSNQQRVSVISTSSTVTGSNTQPELEWNELLPMLTMTTDQMTGEIHPGTTSGPQQTQSMHSATSLESNDPLENLKVMLASMDVDERAKPAVLSFKQAVEGFPPSRRVAECLSLICRCPAILALVILYGLGSPVAFPSTITLLPFIAFEVLRVQEWTKACQRAFAENNETPPSGANASSLLSLPSEMDSMCIVLSDDKYSSFRQSPLLQVWANVCSSVSALEKGLTAARCVRTTAVATEFAGNIMSLAQFGVEVSQKGWLHGVAVMAKELIHMHANSGQSGQVRNGDVVTNTKYTSAAINAVKNGNVVANNVGIILEESGANPSVEAVVGVVKVLFGCGWLWGKEENAASGTDTAANANSGQKPANDAFSLSQQHDSPVIGKTSKTSTETIDIVAACLRDTSEVPVSDDSFTLQNEELTESAPATEDAQELACVLERLADAYERGLIDEVNSELPSIPFPLLLDAESVVLLTWRLLTSLPSKDEKDVFMEMLADDEDISSTKSKTGGNIDVVSNSLECLFKEAALQSMHQTENYTSSGKPAVTLDNSHENKKQPEQLTASRSRSCEAEDLLQCQTPASESLCPVAQKRLVREPVDGASISTCSDSRGVKVDNVSSQNSVATFGVKSNNGVNDCVIDCTSSVTAAESVGSYGETCHNEQHSASAGRKREETSPTHEGEHWLKLAGLGVVGAVIGGLAIVNAGKHSENSNGADEQEQRQRERATPYIEEVVDDETGTNDDWESISESTSNVQQSS